MKKEKKVRTYQRRTKSGKMVTVKAHTAKYDAAEKAMEMAKKKGAGKELEERRKQPVQLEIPFEDGDEKKILDEVKEKEKSNGKKTTKKETEEKKPRKKRTVGTGTNGPESKKSTSRKISSDLVKKYAASEDIDTKTARRELKEMTDKEFNKVQKYHDKESTPKRMSERSLEKLSGKISKKDFFAGKTSSKKKAEKTSKDSSSEPAFTAAEFKEWYHGTGSAADKKVAKALRAQLGRTGYRKLEDEAIDNYSARGHLSMFKRVSGGISEDKASVKAEKKSNKAVSTKTAPKEKWTASSELKSHFDTMNEYKKATMEAIKTGDPKKIRQARNSYNLAFTRYGDIASKKDRVSAEKEYSKVIAALNKAGYDEFGYKKRVSSKSEPTEKKSSSSSKPTSKESTVESTSTPEKKTKKGPAPYKAPNDWSSIRKLTGWNGGYSKITNEGNSAHFVLSRYEKDDLWRTLNKKWALAEATSGSDIEGTFRKGWYKLKIERNPKEYGMYDVKIEESPSYRRVSKGTSTINRAMSSNMNKRY